MPNKIQIKRGNKVSLPVLSDGELGLCKDTKELFLGNAISGNMQIETTLESNAKHTVINNSIDNIVKDRIAVVPFSATLLADASTVIQNLLNTCTSLEFPSGTFKVKNLTSGICKYIGGTGTLLNLANSSMLTISSDNVVIADVEIKGTGVVGNTLEKGIVVDAKKNTKINNVSINGFLGGSGFYITNILTNHRGAILNGCTFYNNNIGFNSEVRGEFTNLSQCVFYGNTIALSIKGGNVTVDNCEINDNVDAIRLLSGDNDSHGKVTNCNINHNTGYGLYIDGIINGETITSNHIYESSIYIKNCIGKAIEMANNVLDPRLFYGENTTLLRLNDNYFPNGFLVNLVDLDFKRNSSQCTVLASNNVFYNDTFNKFLNSIIGGFLYLTRTTPQTLTPNIANVISGDVTYNSTAFNLNDTTNIFYNPTTSSIIKKFPLGYVQLNVSFKVTKLSTDTSLGWGVYATSGGINIGYGSVTAYSTTMMIFSLNLFRGCNVGEELQIKVLTPAGVTASVMFSEFEIRASNL